MLDFHEGETAVIFVTFDGGGRVVLPNGEFLAIDRKHLHCLGCMEQRVRDEADLVIPGTGFRVP